MQRHVTLIVLLCVGLSNAPQSVAGQAARAQGQPAPIRGRVVAAEHGAALPRVRIDAIAAGPSPIVFTDDEGRFTIAAADRPIRLLATKGGYAAATVSIPRTTADSSSELLLRLERSGALSGRVTDSTGAPAVAVPVIAEPVQDGGSAPLEFSTITDDSGEYRIAGMPAGRYLVRQRAPVIVRTSVDDTTATPTPSFAEAFSPRIRDQSVSASTLVRRPTNAPTAVQGPAREVEIRPGAEVADFDFVTNLDPSPMLLTAPPSRENRETLARLREQGATATIRGRVLARPGEAIAQAGVRLLQEGKTARVTVADQRGRFSLDGLPPGDYTLNAEKTGYLRLGYGQLHPAQTDKTITLRPGVTVEGIDILLPRTSAIAGTVVDEHGEPLQGATVQALQLQHVAGRIVARRTAFERRTDDRGRYRVFGLQPGTYLVLGSVDSRPSSSRPGGSPGYAALYAPGTTLIESAMRVEVGVAQDVGGVDLVFAQSRAARVAGRVVDSNGDPLAGSVTLSARREAGAIVPEPRLVPVGANGAFTLPDVLPGEYVVQAIGARGPGRGAEFGAERVSVGDSDPPPVTVRTSLGATLEGRIVIEGQQSRVNTVSLVAVSLDPDRAAVAGRGPSSFSVSSSGRFYFTGLYGPTRLALASSTGDWYLKSVTIGGRDVTYSGFDFGFAQQELTDAEVEIAFASATVSGFVTGTRAASPESAVVIFSTDPEKWFGTSGHLKAVRVFEDGSFMLRGLPPGDYWIAAVDRLERTAGSGDWQTADVLDDLTSRAIRVTLAEGDQRLIRLPTPLRI